MADRRSESTSQGEELLAHALYEAELTVEGHLSGASNATLRCVIDDDEFGELMCVYKPRRGERPLWDFPTGSLGHREVAARIIDQRLGWELVPATVWRDEGPYGPGMCQVWIDDDGERPAVDVIHPDEYSPSWKIVLEATTYDGSDVLLVHEDTPQLQRLAVFDLVTNNADRKGGHVLRRHNGDLVGIDHGLTFHVEPKVRTVLWGWAGEQIPDDIMTEVVRLGQELAVAEGDLATVQAWLTRAEWSALIARVEELIDSPFFPKPRGDEPALPWPPM